LRLTNPTTAVNFDIMTESEWSDIKPHTIEGNYQRPDYEEILRTKAYIDERSRREWHEEYGEVHEEYVTVQTQVFVDDVSQFGNDDIEGWY
jgi:hypothetical protein